MPDARDVLFNGNVDDDSDMFAIDQSPKKKPSDGDSPELHVGRVRNYCNEALVVRVLKPASKLRFFLLSGNKELSKPEELLIAPADAIGTDFTDKVRWQRSSERQRVLEISKLSSNFRYAIVAEGNYLGYEKIRTLIHKNGSGQVIH